MQKLFILSTLFLLSSCTTAGPFITNITPNKDGTFTVEKCLIEYTGFGTLSNKNCTVSTVYFSGSK